MFKVRDKQTGKIYTVITVTGNGELLMYKDEEFQYVPMDGYEFLDPFEVHDPHEALPSGDNLKEVTDCTLHMYHEYPSTLENVLHDIEQEACPVRVGDTISCKLKNGDPVDIVVTAVTCDSVRFETRDCSGKYVPMTEMKEYLEELFKLLPDEFQARIVPTERRHYGKDGELEYSNERLFLPAASEIFSGDEVYGDKGLYEQMPYYKDIHNRVRAFKKGDDTDAYWTSSRYSGGSTYWCVVGYSGHASGSGATNTGIAAPVCFRIPRF